MDLKNQKTNESTRKQLQRWFDSVHKEFTNPDPKVAEKKRIKAKRNVKAKKIAKKFGF